MSNSDTPQPKLAVVEAPAEPAKSGEPQAPAKPGPPSPAPNPAQTGSQGSRSWLAWLLLAVAVVMAWQWLSQLERATALEAQVATLEAALGEARAEIDAWAGHMEQVRGAVDGVVAQLGALQSLVAEPPRAAAPSEEGSEAGAEGTGEAEAAPEEPTSGADQGLL